MSVRYVRLQQLTYIAEKDKKKAKKKKKVDKLGVGLDRLTLFFSQMKQNSRL